ncbi:MULTISPECIES: hypothetical protein [Bacillaceae]|uniref:Uncharacterized protein n=1 Tax=Alkalicoccobacillus plakortidis TaxID=444060 RepID=A0A9D5DW70_9BACI|nr:MULTISPECIES: hypothetical protein [Bacillaceae]KQL58300.1 hypothetical protein AN965_04375 [Alkalicoccobacillus plakortidis]
MEIKPNSKTAQKISDLDPTSLGVGASSGPVLASGGGGGGGGGGCCCCCCCCCSGAGDVEKEERYSKLFGE